MFLDVDKLEHRYGSLAALRDVSFQVAEGEFFGLLGPNGAGKTTLLTILSGLMDASGGEARLLGRVLRRRDRDLRRWIGIVPQELAVYGELTAAENLRFFGKLHRIDPRVLEDRTERILSAIGLLDRANQRVDGFSGGMKRRLNLGAALIHEPRLLLCDEPTTGVDPQSRNHLFEELRRVNREGMTVIYTSHYMEEVESLCTRIGIIDHGQLIACDDLSTMLRQVAGVIEFRASATPDLLLDRLGALPNIHRVSRNGAEIEISSDDVKGSLVQLISLLNEFNLSLVSLETEEPNLERIFLHLTGRELRD